MRRGLLLPAERASGSAGRWSLERNSPGGRTTVAPSRGGMAESVADSQGGPPDKWVQHLQEYRVSAPGVGECRC